MLKECLKGRRKGDQRKGKRNAKHVNGIKNRKMKCSRKEKNREGEKEREIYSNQFFVNMYLCNIHTRTHTNPTRYEKEKEEKEKRRRDERRRRGGEEGGRDGVDILEMSDVVCAEVRHVRVCRRPFFTKFSIQPMRTERQTDGKTITLYISAMYVRFGARIVKNELYTSKNAD